MLDTSELELADNVDGILDDLLQMTNPSSESPSTGARMEVSPTGCWSQQIVGPDHDCIPWFVVGAGHFKNKFCERCRTDGIMVAAERVCLATPALKDQYANTNTAGVWTKGVRLVNQTTKCQGPPVLIFQDRHVPKKTAAMAAPVPDDWLYFAQSSATTAYVRFIISKGTLVPTASPFADAGIIQLQRLESAAKRARNDESGGIRAPPGVLEPELSEQVWRTSPTCTPPGSTP